ncbi:choice-of-anchor D domain-containing protein [Brevifollis gellanilyticus]|uniref:Fibronectin type-III domain-containing protein n=1 Tax=Brevifollis gellanilyticus TaxID=748831 RepID=A0A512M5A4_9BACT|nr:choice-of-anchor D domain-containing protein [Brevifollis gellanilyticus]GEP41912.1 hypothetical protein BGE01nite_12030 [Brevifollis gellanilyticus]
MSLDLTFRSLFRVSLRAVSRCVLPALAGLLLAAPSADAALSAAFNAATDVPVTASSYAPAGEVDFTLNFAPDPGTNLTVVKNTGLPFIEGAFSNLANGATVNLSYNGATYPFVAWYYGGEGNNDLVLLWPYTLVAGWGHNLYGQLGDGTRADKRVPTRVDQAGVLAGKTVVQVVQGGIFSLALTTEGRVYSWGSDFNGALGNSSTTEAILPVAVNTESGTSALYGKEVVYLTAGRNHSLAVCSDGTVVGWGRNDSGQLGDGTTQNRPMPVMMNTLSGASALSGKSAVSVSAGQDHTLVLCSDGTMVSCGGNGSGQLGDGTLIQRLSPVSTGADAVAMDGKKVVSISSGRSHNLALCSDGTLMSWGSGALGDTVSQRSVVAPVNSASGTSALFGKNVAAISAGHSHSLALCTDGTVTGWGDNSSWQLGDTLPGRALPVSITSGALSNKQVVSVAAASASSLALLADNTLVFWGVNNRSGGSRPVVVEQIVGVSALGGVRVSRLPSACHTASHVLSIYRVPFNEITVRGNGREILNGDMSPDFADHTNFSTVLLNTQARVRTFTITNTGMAELNLTGAPKVTISGPHAADFIVASGPVSPLDPLSGTTTFQIAFDPKAAGIRHATVSVMSDDHDESFYTFGIQGVGSLGGFSFDNGVDAAVTADNYAATGEASLTLNFAPEPGTNLTVVKNTGPAFLEGTFSNLPNGSTVNLNYNGVTYPFVVWYYGGEGNNDLVLLWPRTVLAAWGNNSSGQLAVSNYGDFRHDTPELADISGLLEGKTLAQVSQGGAHTLALTTEGKVYAWGSNQWGQLGDNTLVKKSAPVGVNTTDGVSSLSGKKVVAIAAGYNHSLALCSDGTVSAWGSNYNAELGNGTITDSAVPVPVDTATGTSTLHGKVVTALAAGSSHNLALCSDGTLAAWGAGGSGQLGDGGSVQRRVPVAVNATEGMSALSGKVVTSMAVGWSHSVALCADGSMVAWGGNAKGQLGDGSTTSRLLPVTVSVTGVLANKTVTSICAGESHNIALCSDGTIASWGENDEGQIGDDSGMSRTLPVMVNITPGSSALADKTVVSIACGEKHNLALCTDNTLVAWGYNYDGQLGDDSSATRSRVPVNVYREGGFSRGVLAGKTITGLPSRSGVSSGSSMVIFEGALRDISVTGNGKEIVNGDTTPESGDLTDFGNVPQVGDTVKRTFWIANKGVGMLQFTGTPYVEIYGNHFYSDHFFVSRQPAQTYTSSNGRVSFDITCSPRALGLQTATVTIRSDAPDEPVYTFSIQCFGRGSEIEVREAGVNVASGGTVSFGRVASGWPRGVARKTFVINNLGNEDLTDLTFIKSGQNPYDYTILVPPTAPVPPGGNTSFVVQASPGDQGARSAVLRITNNDFNEYYFDIVMTATGGDSTPPATTRPTVTGVTMDGATLKTEVDARGSERWVLFEYGTTPDYGSQVAATPDTVTGYSKTNVSATITGLLPNTKYHFRVRAEGVMGSANGEDKTFTTLNRLPVAVADSAVVLPGGQVVIPVLGNDVDPGDVLNIASFTQPAATAGKVTKVGNTLVFTGAAGFSGGTFSYAAGDAYRGKSSPATVTLTLGTCSIGPDVTVSADSPPYELAVIANAPFGVIENVSWLSFVPPAPGTTSVTFIPAPNASKTARTATVNVGGKTHTVTQSGVSAVPVLTVPDPIPLAAISASYELGIPTQNGPVTYMATGLPKGLTLSNASGKITGYPSEAKTSTVTVKAKNVQGESNTISFDITVLDIPATVVGSFSAVIESDTTLTDRLGGFMTITVTKTGAVSGTLKLGAGSHPFTGKLSTAENPAEPDPEHAVLRTSVKRTGKPNVDLVVRMNDDETDFISGDVTLPGAEPVSLELEGGRHVWDAKTKPADSYKGNFTVVLPPTSTATSIPQGDGFLTFTVTPAGAVSWSGQLADGTVIPAQTSAVWADGRVPLFVVFGKGLGSLTQTLRISAGTRLVTGPLRWHKKPQVMRAFGNGFESATLQANGSEYLPPVAGKTLLDRPAPATYRLDFLDGGIEDVRSFIDLDQVFSMSVTHVLSSSTPNPSQVKITKIDLTKGTFIGTMTLKDTNPFNAGLPEVSRTLTFQGVLFSYMHMGTGYFLLPGITGPPVNVTKSAMTSGQVRIEILP